MKNYEAIGGGISERLPDKFLLFLPVEKETRRITFTSHENPAFVKIQDKESLIKYFEETYNSFPYKVVCTVPEIKNLNEQVELKGKFFLKSINFLKIYNPISWFKSKNVDFTLIITANQIPNFLKISSETLLANK